MKKLKFFILAVCLLSTSFNTLAQSKLQTSKNELKQTHTNHPSNSSRLHQSSASGTTVWDEQYSDHFFADLMFKIAASIGYYTVIGAYGAEDHLHNNLSPYPYINHEAGNYTKCTHDSDGTKTMRLDIQNNLLISGEQIYGNHLHLKFRPVKYVYSIISYRELMDFSVDQLNNLSLFHASVAYDRLRFKAFNLGFHLGLNYVANTVNKAGFAYGVNAACFAIPSFSLSVDLNWSKINHQNVNTIHFEGAYHLKRYKIAMGYQHLQIASPRYNFFTLGFGIYL